MSNLVMWNLIIGFLLPNLVAVLQQPKFTPAIRALITFVVAVIGGFLTAYFNGQFNFEDVVGSILITGVAAITFYKGFWKPTGVATGIENATSKTPPYVEDVHPSDGPQMKTRRRDMRGAIDAVQALVIAILALGVIFLIVALADRI